MDKEKYLCRHFCEHVQISENFLPYLSRRGPAQGWKQEMSVFLWDCAGLYQHPVLSHEPCGLCLYVVSFSNCVGPHSIASAIKQAHLVNVPRAAEPLLQLVQWREELTSGLSVLEGGTVWKPVAIVPCHFAASAFILLTVKDGDHFSLLLKKISF